jgi:hypothetical protein
LNYFRPPTGKVANVIIDSQEQDEDDTFVVRETVLSKGPGLSDLDEAPVCDFYLKNMEVLFIVCD